MDPDDIYRVRDLIIKMTKESVRRSESINEKLARIQQLHSMFSATADGHYEVIQKINRASLVINNKYLVRVEVDRMRPLTMQVYMGAWVLDKGEKINDADSVTVEERHIPAAVTDYGNSSVVDVAIILTYADVIAEWLEKVVDEVLKLYDGTEEDLAPLMEIVNAIEVARRLSDDK